MSEHMEDPEVVELLDGIPGAYERAMENLASARRGEMIALDDLAPDEPAIAVEAIREYLDKHAPAETGEKP